MIVFEKYRDAGVLAAKILQDGAQGIRVGASYLDLVESIEAQVTEEGAALAFPLNLSLNEDAAHDTASYGDERIFAKGDVAKLDLGVQIDGYIADTATTVDLGNNSLLLAGLRTGARSCDTISTAWSDGRRTRGGHPERDREPGLPPDLKPDRTRA